MALIIKGGSSTDLADVNSDKELKVAPSQDPTKAGYAKLAFGTGIPLDGTEDGHLLVSEDTVIFFDQVDGAAVDSNKWNASDVSGMTITQSGGFITLNAAAATTANAWAILKTVLFIPLYPEFPFKLAMDLKLNVTPQSNVTIEFGLGNPTGSGAITDGVFFRMATDASFKGVVINTSNETDSTAITAVSVNVVHDFDVLVEVGDSGFIVDDGDEHTVMNAPGNPFSVGITRIPIFFRVINGSSPPGTAPQLSLGRISAVQKILKPNRTWGETLSLLGRGGYQSPVTTFAQTTNHANSASPTSATLSNTAAGYTTVGGRFQFAAVAGAATDFALFGYQVPAGFQFIVTGISITCAVTGLAVVTATILDWSIGINASAVSLATADGSGTWAPRRIPLGTQGFIALAGIGVNGPEIRRDFNPPLVINSGRFLHVILQVPAGAATALLVFRGDVTITGYFE